jgi:opacity protein-like surface antigen
MKKLLSAVLVIVFLSAAEVFAAPEINVKAGFDFANNATLYSKDKVFGYTAKDDTTKTSDIGFQAGGEILFPVWKFIKIGGGLAYVAPRQINKNDESSDPLKISMIPIYFTAQANPIKKIPEIFFKTDIGFSVLTFSGASGGISLPGSAVYVGIGGGYEFSFGLILDLSYHFYSSTTESDTAGNHKYEWSYSFGSAVLSAGYKFKL